MGEPPEERLPIRYFDPSEASSPAGRPGAEQRHPNTMTASLRESVSWPSSFRSRSRCLGALMQGLPQSDLSRREAHRAS
jgi:hypothetical protein